MKTYRTWRRYKCTAILPNGQSMTVTVKSPSKEEAREFAKKLLIQSIEIIDIREEEEWCKTLEVDVNLKLVQ